MKNKICIVLGAGASHAYGFPVGSGLRKCIVDLKNDNEFIKCAGFEQTQLAKEFDLKSSVNTFCEEFLLSGMKSIDAFLARRAEFVEIGKKAIAYILLSSEAEYKLTSLEIEDHWYEYFWNKICTEKWQDFNLSHISVVSFNYDRSFEKYLATTIAHSYKKTIEEACKKISEIKIVHVYGSLGPTMPSDENYLEYGNSISREKVKAAASLIQVISESRDNSDSIQIARDLLLDANSIAFLGFGFDSLNMLRLDLKNSCKVDFLTGNGWIERKIYFTCFGLEQEEATSITSKLDKKLQSHFSVGYPHSFYNTNCTTLLRKTQFLD